AVAGRDLKLEVQMVGRAIWDTVVVSYSAEDLPFADRAAAENAVGVEQARMHVQIAEVQALARRIHEQVHRLALRQAHDHAVPRGNDLVAVRTATVGGCVAQFAGGRSYVLPLMSLAGRAS